MAGEVGGQAGPQQDRGRREFGSHGGQPGAAAAPDKFDIHFQVHLYRDLYYVCLYYAKINLFSQVFWWLTL